MRLDPAKHTFVLVTRVPGAISSTYPEHIASVVNSKPNTPSHSIFHRIGPSTEPYGTPVFVSAYSSGPLFIFVFVRKFDTMFTKYILWYRILDPKSTAGQFIGHFVPI